MKMVMNIVTIHIDRNMEPSDCNRKVAMHIITMNEHDTMRL